MTPILTRVAMLALLAGTAGAQDAAPETAPEPRERPAAEPVTPTTEPRLRPPRPGLTGNEAWPDDPEADDDSPIARRLPEGTTLVRRPGRLLTLATGHRVFVTDEDARFPGEGPMLVFPSRVLASLDASVAGAPSAPVVLSGYVYEYAGRNYLLPTAFSRDTLPPPEPEPEPDAGPDADAPGAASGGQDRSPAASDADIASAFDDPDIASLLTEIDSQPSVRAVAPPRAQETPGETDVLGSGSVVAGSETYIADGTPITRRLARLVRGPGGAWAFRFDNDFDTAGTPMDEPLTVLPCRLLESLESMAMTRGDGIELIVSGRVYTYGRRSYILPTLFQRPLKLGIDPRQ